MEQKLRHVVSGEYQLHVLVELLQYGSYVRRVVPPVPTHWSGLSGHGSTVVLQTQPVPGTSRTETALIADLEQHLRRRGARDEWDLTARSAVLESVLVLWFFLELGGWQRKGDHGIRIALRRN